MEVWKQIIIDSEEWSYEVSSYGRVRNSKTGRLLKFTTTKDGYLRTTLCKQGKAKNFLVHRLVALMFIPNSDKTKTEVNHKSEVKTENFVENLEWVSHEENMRWGTQPQKHCKAVYYIENGVAIVYPSARSAELDGFSGDCISACCRGKHKTHKGKEWHYVS